MIRIGLAILLASVLASPAAAGPCPVSAQADMARRMQGLQGCLQDRPPEAPAPSDPLAGPRSPAVAGCQSNASAQPVSCSAPTKAAPIKRKARARVPKPTKQPRSSSRQAGARRE